MELAEHFKSLGIDEKDLHIMRELDVNCRQTNSALGKKTGLEKSVVAYRIKRLLERGLIRKFYAVVDTGMLGYRGYRMYLKFQFLDPEKEKEITDFIKEQPFTWWVGSAIGEWDMGLVVWMKEFSAFSRFWFDFFGRYQKHVQRKELAIYAKLYSCPYTFLSPGLRNRKDVQEIGSDGNESLSAKEEKVLGMLAENARMPLTEIAKDTGVSVSGVKYIIKRLRKGGIIRAFRVQFDDSMLGLSLYKVNFHLDDMGAYGEMLNFALSDPRVVYVPKCLGTAEFEVEVMARDIGDLESFLRNFVSRFSASIRNYEYFVFRQAHKIRYWE